MRKKNQGFMLITTLIMAVILFIVCATFSSIVKQDAQKIKSQEYNIIAHYVAEGGVQYIKAQMCMGKIPSSFPVTGDTKEIYNDKSVKGSFTVTFDNLSSPAASGDASYPFLYKITSTAEIKINSIVLARKTIQAEIATTAAIADLKSASGYVYREYEKYR